MIVQSMPTLEQNSCSLGSLLNRWSKLEPDTCRFLNNKTAYELKLDTPSESIWYKLSETACENLDYAVLQSCVQDALSQHSMNWRLSFTRGVSEACVEYEGQSYNASVSSEAMALLWAYLNALEQQHSISLKA